MTQIRSVGGEIRENDGEKWGPRRGQLDILANTGNIEAQVLSATSGYWAWLLPVPVTILNWRFKTTLVWGLRWPPLENLHCVVYTCTVCTCTVLCAPGPFTSASLNLRTHRNETETLLLLGSPDHQTGLNWPEPYIHTVYDRMYGDFPAENTVCTLYAGINIWFWPTLNRLYQTL